PLTIEVRDGVSICDRTRQIRDRIVDLISSSHDCNFVLTDALASVSMLDEIALGRVTELLPHDFNGMRGLENLDLSSLAATGLPEDIFRDTPNLRELNLAGSSLESLPPDIFMNLNRLENLDFVLGDLTELPARLLADLEKEPLITLGVGSDVRIGGIQYRLDGAAVAEVLTPDVAGVLALDEGVRHRLQIEVAGGVRSALTLVFRHDGELPLTATPTTIGFSPQADEAVIELMVPPDMGFADRSGSVSWEWGMYIHTPPFGVPEIRTRRLQVNVRNTETFFLEDADPSLNTISMSAAVGTRVAGVMPAARIGRVGATVAATGAEYALTGGGLFTVNSASGVISLARLVTDGDRGRRPVTLTATYRNTSASLPLVISVLHADGGFDICGRTPVVRDEILRRVNEGGGTLDCTDVPAADMASVQTLDFSANPATVETLRADDFDGLSGLTGLNLRSLGLQSLPPDIFRGLANLRMLNLQDSRLTSLPARLLADLEKPAPVTAGFDAGVLIGGVQYRAGGEAITELPLDEGASRRLRIEIAGGVGSTWTLVARPDGSPLPVVTPETIRFSPSAGADAVIVELTAPRDDNFDGNTGSVSWAWTMFNAAGTVTEIRTQSLRLDVLELDRFEDIDLEPNHISEAAAAGDPVLSWSPRVLVRGVVTDGVRYRLLRDAGGLFRIDSASGVLSPVADRTLDYTVSSSHQVTVAVDVPGVSAVPPLAAAIEVRAGFVIRDTDTSANIIAATAATGTLVGGMAPLVRFGARVLTDGVVYSLAVPDGLFTVNTATGLIFSARPFTDGDIRAHPVTLTASHTSGTASLPLDIEVRPGVSICDRTPGVRDEILDIINSRPGGATYNCHVVRSADLASISTLNLSLRLNRTDALLAHDFDGMAGLRGLNLRAVPLASLPDGIFSDTTNLRVLNLGNIRSLRSLPSDIFSNLERLENLDLTVLGATSLPGNIFSGLSNLSVLNLSGIRLTSLPPNLFSNLSQLQNLNLESTRFTNLPDGIFSDLNDLRVLNLFDSGLASVPPDILMNLGRLESLGLSAVTLAELPARLLADLERIRPRVLRIDADVRIGGIQYRADGAPITVLTLEEGGSSRDLQIEAADGVRSTLTLVFQSSAESGLAAMPTTVRLTPARRMATVTLAVPEDLNVVNRSGPAQWTWRFNPAGADEVAVRAADLPVSVRDTHRFEDTEPAANRISETASPGDEVSGWSPQVVVGGVVQSAVSYSLPSDAGGLFAIHAGNGALSLAPGQTLDYAASSAHQVTVVARVTASGATASLAATIEVVPMLFLSDTDSSPNIIFATAAMGTPVAGVALEARLGGDILTEGVTYTLTGSGLFTVNSASGVISAAQQLTEDNTGDYPVTLTATHPRGLPGNLPLTIEVFEGLSVCNRTPVIRDDIMRLVNSDREVPYVCDSVPSARLASITTLNFSGRLNTVTALQADDFAGMTGLENLDLSLLGITAASEVSLPEGLFRDTTSLRVLNLRNSRLMPLPPRLLADLERPPRVTAGFDTAAGIGGIQYFVDGAATTGPLTLDGGGSLNLRVEIAGGVHSTLTLVLRADGVALVATPTAVEFGPFSSTNMAVVEWSAPLGLSLADSGGPVFYAWEMFDAAAGGAAEIRAQSLQVNVRNMETLSLEDADPAPNTIAATATAGTNVAGVAPTVRVGAVVVTTGVAYALTGSALFAVHSTSGAIFSTSLLTDANRGRHPVTLTASYRGGESSLPLVIGVHPAGGFDICDRTPVVQEEILYRVNTQAEVRALGTPYRCANIPAIYMASVQTLNFSGYSTTVETLLVHDFEGLSGLTSLNLTSLGLRRLPPAVFGGLANLQSLTLSDNNLAPLPPDFFRGLSRLNILYMRSLGLRSLPPGIFSDLPLLFDLDLSTNNLASLPPNLFGNQPLLSALSLTGNRLTSLPQDIFSGLINLQFLELVGNDNLVLPARVVADLARQPLIEVQMDRSARIGGIQYRLDGGVVTQLALHEGESRNLQVRVDGGIGSTLTLVARIDGAPPLAVTPPTIRFGPSPGTDTAVVELTARADRNNFGRSTGSVSWAWTMLLDEGAVEIRTQSLRLDVFEPVSLEDADPSTNIIAASAVTGTPVGGITPVARIRGVVQTDGVMYSLDGGLADLFAVNTASGVIFAARQLEESDVRARAYPVTLTASHTLGMASLPLDIEVRSGVSICDRTAGVRDEILRII
ncbi:MAG: leucine-rich repeat protein, partial [Gammaproteobacteria bacterium]|nr:leucine-rich repeat protein [Gammaproteobacteria bacterium]